MMMTRTSTSVHGGRFRPVEAIYCLQSDDRATKCRNQAGFGPRNAGTRAYASMGVVTATVTVRGNESPACATRYSSLS